MFKDQISYASELNTLVCDLFDIKKITKKEVDAIADEFGEHTDKTITDFRTNIKKIVG